MARVIITEPADEDIAEALTYLAREAGFSIAEEFNRRLLHLFERLARHPESGHPRPKLGKAIRIGIVSPYLAFYEYDAGADVVGIIRVLHGSRRINRSALGGVTP